MDQNEIPHEPGHLGLLSGLSKVIFEPVLRSVQTVPPILQTDRNEHALRPRHLGVHESCIDTNTVSKQTKMRFHMTHVT
jgi:hypothetical protein